MELEVEHGFSNATCKYVSGKADHLLRPCKRVDNVLHLWAHARVVEYGEFIEPRVVDEASVAQPVDGEFGVLRIWYDSQNYANLEATKRQYESARKNGQRAPPCRDSMGDSGTHICASTWAGGIITESLLGWGLQLGKVLLDRYIGLREAHFVHIFRT